MNSSQPLYTYPLIHLFSHSPPIKETYMERDPRDLFTHQHQHHHHHYPSASPEMSLLSSPAPPSQPPSRYESQKRRDWNTFVQYLRNKRPPVPLPQCTCSHVLEFLHYLDQFGKTKVHLQGCIFYGQPEPPAPCPCPLRQAWGSLDALIGRLRAAYEENGGAPDTNPFAGSSIRVFLREVRDCQAKARGIPYKKKKPSKRILLGGGGKDHQDDHNQSGPASSSSSSSTNRISFS